MKPLNIILLGIAGRMGLSNLAYLLKQSDLFCLAGVLEHSDHDFVGKKLGEVFPALTLNADQGKMTIVSELDQIPHQNGVVIDFTKAEATLSHLEKAKNKKSQFQWVIGTTGFSAKQREVLVQHSQHAAVVFAGNFSLSIALLMHFAKQAARVFPDSDVEVSETHHREKKDAPSGTAFMLADAVKEGRDLIGMDAEIICGRNGTEAKRKKGEIGLAALRGGSVVGEHSVHFFSDHDKIVLSHTAHSRELFSAGAFQAARFVSSYENGLFSMQDVISDKISN